MSTTGLKNKGRVTFEDTGPVRCLMTLTLSYDLPFVSGARRRWREWRLDSEANSFRRIVVFPEKYRRSTELVKVIS